MSNIAEISLRMLILGRHISTGNNQ